MDDAIVKGEAVREAEWRPTVKRTRAVATPSPTAAPPTRPLTDWEIVDFVKKYGPIARADLPLRHQANQSLLISNWIREGQLVIVAKNSRGQVLACREERG